jgi:hypothetical protein
MFGINDLFQWERFVTPSIIKLFFWLMVAIMALMGLCGIISAVGLMSVSAGLGIAVIVMSVLGVVAGVFLARIAAEFILIVFRINEHLGAIRSQGEAYEQPAASRGAMYDPQEMAR